MNGETLIITTSVNGRARTQLWDSAAPLALGHPFRWILERTAAGIRLRDLAARAGVPRDGAVHELAVTGELRLPELTIQVRPARVLSPAFAAAPAKDGKLQIFACRGSWTLSAGPLGDRHVARVEGERVFMIYKKAGEYRVDFFREGVTANCPEPRPAAVGQALRLPEDRLSECSIAYGGITWRFAAAREPRFTPSLAADDGAGSDTAWFRGALRASIVALGALSVMTWLWPKPQPTEELIPPQFARIVMTKPAAAPAAAAKSVAQANVKQAEQAAVVQAFRAKALKSAVSGLLKGGMTRLLAQSDFVSGEKASADARRIFDRRQDALRATGPNLGLADARQVKVASIGGESMGSRGVGYAKGEHAGVKGQGSALVSHTLVAAVEEGLTKDEVGEVIHRHLSEVRYCYESAMIRMPDLEGKLTVDFTIGGVGSVKSAAAKASTLPDPRLDDCIIRRLVTWKFPQPKGGIDVAVTYPFIFKTLGR